MTLLYLILTTKENVNTRQRWQKQSWLKDVDYVYLNEPFGEESYHRVAYKCKAWLEANELKHDWYFFCDDDTWVYTKKLVDFLSTINKCSVVGCKGGTFEYEGVDVDWCSGGAGIAISNALLWAVKYRNQYYITSESDTSLAIWCKLAAPDMVLLNRPDLFHPQPPVHYKDGITFHYCCENDFINLNKSK